MFRYFFAIILLAAFAAQTFRNTAIVMSYYTNQASYARYCENKAKPRLHCNGKCQLMKKIAEEEKKDQQNPGRKIESRNEVISSRSFFATVDMAPASPRRSYHIPYSEGHPADCSLPVFHPPSMS